MDTFQGWCKEQLIAERLVPLHICTAFEVLVSRIDAARAAGSTDPMRTVSTSLAGPNSRRVTHRMLASLGYSASQRRIVHRLLSGSASGWPGLLMLLLAARPCHFESAGPVTTAPALMRQRRREREGHDQKPE